LARREYAQCVNRDSKEKTAKQKQQSKNSKEKTAKQKQERKQERSR
jgi:hypothetical protein